MPTMNIFNTVSIKKNEKYKMKFLYQSKEIQLEIIVFNNQLMQLWFFFKYCMNASHYLIFDMINILQCPKHLEENTKLILTTTS